MDHNTVEIAEVNDFDTSSRCQDLDSLINSTLLDHIINKIKKSCLFLFLTSKTRLNGDLLF